MGGVRELHAAVEDSIRTLFKGGFYGKKNGGLQRMSGRGLEGF